MTPINTVCPTADVLQKVASGNGAPGECEELASHIEQCRQCGESLDTLLAKDPTVQALQGGKRLELPNSQRLDELKESLRQLRPAALAVANQTETFASSAAETMTQNPVPVVTGMMASVTFLGPPQLPDELGRLGQYRVLKQLGAGGMGMVFLAEDTLLHRKVALKTMRPEFAANPDARERFLREARAAAAVEHEHIITIHQVGEDHGVPYLAMPLLKGECLEDRIARQRLPIPEVLRICAEMADGLAAAHEHGLIHRDIKPGNVWLEGEQSKVKLLDFGLARAQADDSKLTKSGAIVGTPAYMAPEQARGEELDSRADLFSLGAVLYSMLTGNRPFGGENTMNVLMALALDDPTEPRKLNREVSAELNDLTMRLLAKSPSKRPGTAQEVAAALRQLLPAESRPTRSFQMPALPTASGAKGRSGNPASRTIAVALAGLASLVIVAAGIYFTVRSADGKIEMVFQADDQEIEISVKTDDMQQPVVQVVDKNSKKVIELKPGEGVIEARELPDGLRFKTQHFEIKRGDKPVFTAEMLLAKAKPTASETPPAKTNPPPTAVTPAAVSGTAPVYVETPEFTTWKTEVAALPVEQQVAAVSKKLQELNPGFNGILWGLEGQQFPTIRNGVVADFQFNVDHVTDISPIRVFAKVHHLELKGSWDRGRLVDLAPLQGLRPRILRVIGTQVRDLTPLRGMQLKGIELSNTPVSDLSPLKGMPLTWLMCGGTKVEDLTPLKGSPLEFLECPDCRIKDFSPLEKCPLREMKIWTTRPEGQVAAYETLRTLKSLATVNYKPVDTFFAEIPGMAELERTIKKLRELNPGYDGVILESKIEREHVTELRFASSDLTNLAPLRELKKLKKLELLAALGPSFTPKLTDISQLEGMSLTWLSLQAQPIVDITPLKGMPLTWLSLAQTNVKDLSPLTGMPLIVLHVNSTPVLDLSPLTGMPLQYLEFTFRPDIKAEVLPSLKSLEMVNHKSAKAFFEDLPMELETYQAIQQLRELNQVDPRNPYDIKVERTKIELTVLGVGAPADIDPLQPLKTLTIFRCPNSPITDLKPLAGKPLRVLEIPSCRVSDLSPLKGMPLSKLDISDAPVTDLSPLAELPLIELTFKGIQPERDGAVLRSIKTLERINGRSVADFWKDFDKK